MYRKWIGLLLIILAATWLLSGDTAYSLVEREEGKTYIVDRTGARWDVTQAESIGFDPEGFQYGLGKDAFFPLDDRFLEDGSEDVNPWHRVIGIAKEKDARAYSVPKLRGHEIANSHIGDTPIAAAY